jgi:hypothetical protein
MSHGGMTATQACEYREVTQEEHDRYERERRVEQARKNLRAKNLREEYRLMKDMQIVLTDRSGTPITRIDIEDLFDMFTLTQEWRDYPV